MSVSAISPVFSPLIRLNGKSNGFYTLVLNHKALYSVGLPTNSGVESQGVLERGSRVLRKQRRVAKDPRTERMLVDQDWTAVYPTAKSFKPDAVPLPVRMGYPVKRGVPPEKKGNLELIKIPNFLHLTPAAIKKHCEALKPFCTDWPAALDSDAKCREHFPLQIQTKDFVSTGPSLRNPDARIVTLTVKLSSLNLDNHARTKFRKLSQERYNKETDMLTIITDSCPLQKQNYDYAMYLLTVLYHESWKIEAWEKEKTRTDMEEYVWEDSPSQKNILETLLHMHSLKKQSEEEEGVREELLGRPEVQEYKDSVTKLKNEGETESNMQQYKKAVKKLLNI